MLASRKDCLILPVGVAVLGVCNCASGLGPMSQGGFSDLPIESSRHREILGRSSSGRWCGATRAWLLPSVPQSDLHPTAASELQQRRRRNNTPTPKYHRPSASTPPPPRPHTTHTHPPSPLHPVVLVSLRPAGVLRYALSQGRACAFLPRLLPRIYVRRGHTDPLPYPSRQQPRHSPNAFAMGHTAKQSACYRYPLTL